MRDNANRTVAVVLALLIVVILGLLLAAGIGGRRGGGGGADTDTSTSLTDVSSKEEIKPLESATPEQSQLQTTVVRDVNDGITLEEFEEELSQSTAPVGENARNAAFSSNVPVTKDVYTSLDQRGFTDIVLEADFTLDGEYSDTYELERESADAYPSYSFEYVSSQGVLWYVYINDGAYFAMPVGSGNSTLSKQIILAETDYVTQYNGIKNEYSDFPLSSMQGVMGVRVDAIDKASLDSYSFDRLNAM